MNRPAFAELLASLQARPRMWLADERFTTFVAFVDGADAASDGALLNGFREALAVEYNQSGSSLTWWGLIADSALPQGATTRGFLGDLDEDQSRTLVAEMFVRLRAFLVPA